MVKVDGRGVGWGELTMTMGKSVLEGCSHGGGQVAKPPHFHT